MLSSTRLFVGNLPAETDEKELHSVFSKYGEITTLDVKSKPATGDDCKKFAFISLVGSFTDIESCIKHFTNEDFNGHRLYVTRARESFLERLQKEREQTQKKTAEKVDHNKIERDPIIKLGDKLNPKKRKYDNDINHKPKKHMKEKKEMRATSPCGDIGTNISNVATVSDKKKFEADKKRMESILKKRQEFKQKQMIIKTGLTGVDKVQNKKVIFSDEFDDDVPNSEYKENHKNEFTNKDKNGLFDDDAEEDDDVNFEIKKQFEGKKGQKVLDLQSRYKSDKRFTLDERFIDDDEEEEKDEKQSHNEEVEIGPEDEKAKQLDILQNVLGITIKSKVPESEKKIKSKPGMLRFDPMLPDHSKFLVPVETKPVVSKKSKKKNKDKQEESLNEEPEIDIPKVEVSKEQFYKVSETLKEAIAQPTSFSLRSLFANNVNDDDDLQEKKADYIPLDTQRERKKVKNPLDPTEKNPFIYDSSDSETEEPEKEIPLNERPVELPTTEVKSVWRENLFFSTSDSRLEDGLKFFNKAPNNEIQKERRELKSLVKKRIYNKDRKNQMFKKKIGGRRKSMKKPYKTNT